MNERTVTTSDAIVLRTCSDGDPGARPLLLLNSLGTDLTMWDDQVEAWARTHHVLRFDHRGHGASEAPDGPYTVDRLGQDAVDVLDAYEVDRADLCGLSLGGLVALWVAGNAPHRVDRAVFADTAAKVGTEEAWRARADTVRAEGMDAVVDLVLTRFFSESFRTSGDPAVTALDRRLRTTSPEGYAASCDALGSADLRELTSHVTADCLVVVGTADEATPPSDAQELHRLLPDAELVELPGAGHLANLEQPDRFRQLVSDFLTSKEASRA